MDLNVGIFTGGGDAPGLNTAIKYATKKILENGNYPFGIIDGWKGVLDIGSYVPSPNKGLYDNLQEILGHTASDLIKKGMHEIEFRALLEAANLSIGPLTAKDVSSWDNKGGTKLGSTRTNPFKIDELTQKDRSGLLLENIELLGLDWIIALGGEDTLRAAEKAKKLGIKVIGIPKTIDADVPGTDYTLGYNTAVGVIQYYVKTFRITAQSHLNIQLVEVMGRDSGELAMGGGIVSSANMILIPEYETTLDQIGKLLVERRNKGSKNDIGIVSEGTKIKEYGQEVASGEPKDEYGHKNLGGVVERMKIDLEKMTRQKIRAGKLGYSQRGADPNPYDVMMGRAFGIAAGELIEQGISGRMVSYLNGKITHVPLEETLGDPVLVDVATRYDTVKLNASMRTLAI